MSDSDSSSYSSSDNDSSSSEDEATIERREYNRRYYQKNKKRILASALKKVECPDCKRKVNSQYLRKHQMSSRCVNNEHIRKIVAYVMETHHK